MARSEAAGAGVWQVAHHQTRPAR